ncbi:hypothetical protein [Actinacidiphila paucisporea]|uniref:Uncharacterized protein n=1 Tax=Actinacidiphila paucisporea TaxID=310782 RepID=A0A1M7QT09_9ACTN|nr:hypothetical protein [Actinacidiphila paucisporea]SHN34564.1 hypothetical protein SAMN05216499_14133 [Actinacidiphila paucisporea]
MDYRNARQTPAPYIPPQRPQQVWDVLPGTVDQEVTVVSDAGMASVHDLVRYDAPAANGQVVPVDQHQPMVWVPAGANNFVAVPKDSLPAGYLHTTVIPAPQPLPAPGPLIDPRAQILAAGGITAAGIGWGAAQILSSLAGLSGGALMGLAVLLVALRMPASRSGGGDTYNVTNTTHNTNKWFGKSTSHNG